MKIPTELNLPQPPAPFSRTYWVVADKLLAGAYPGKIDPEEHLQRLTDLFNSGMRTFVDLMEEDESNNAGIPFVRYDGLLREIAKNDESTQGRGIAHLRFPIRDRSVTTADRMRSILDAIDLSLEAGVPVYVHCFGGIGRTGTAICCWLLRHKLANKANVLSVLKTLRQADSERASWRAPENATQESFVLDWTE